MPIASLRAAETARLRPEGADHLERLRRAKAVDGHSWGRPGPAAGGGGRRPQPFPLTAEQWRRRPVEARKAARHASVPVMSAGHTFHKCIPIGNLRLQQVRLRIG